MKKNFCDINDVGKIYLWSIVLPLILVFVAEIILMAIGQSIGKSLEELLKILPILLALSMLTQISFIVIFFKQSKTMNVKQIAKLNYNLGFKNIIICILIGLIGLFAFSPLSNLGTEFLTKIGFYINNSLTSVITTPLLLIIAIILMAIVPAICEELIFRGLILQGLRKYGDKSAILITSCLFALIHLSADQLIFPFLFSIILCYAVMKTNSIISSMIIHFVSNATSICLNYFGFNYYFDVPIWAFVLIAIGLCVIGYLLIFLLFKLVKDVKIRNMQEVIQMVDDANQSKMEINNNSKVLRYAVYIGLFIFVINFAYCLIY